ncbi:DNA-binding response regulator [Cohnella sp. CIP 111063]|jgi:two-component system response regulator MprA|uniref:response regulator transcription factor n=1 Tax=unclassified Cohnella TaxID=2636738 RepID=UPI000B8C41A4|nr:MULTISPECIES: response regulator transcription factor [unclassified Cohnella]OXS53843.1 DNA-binding response regulator [Cohnella sp. CIP 111063]PRX62424.1 two-component system response regulator MprA [Cohnella sp. SGD-V74]
MRPRIAVIDDDEKITALLRRSLAFEGYEVMTASDGSEGLKLIGQKPADLVILDVMMPKMDGWEVCRRLREAGIVSPILLLTAKDEVSDRVRGLDLGADDYLVKPFALEELMARVRALLRRRSDRTEEGGQFRYEDLVMDVDGREIMRGERRIELTAKEFDLLHLFLQNPKRVLSRDLIMERIWGYDYSGESNVLEVYVAMLRQKLEENGEKRLIQTVRGAGYVLKGDS